VFDSATVDSCILNLKQEKSQKEHIISVVNIDLDFKKELDLIEYINKKQFDLNQNILNNDTWALFPENFLKIQKKIKQNGISLKDYC
jgi:hypothetical protein